MSERNWQENTEPDRSRFANAVAAVCSVITMVARWAYRLRGIILAIPVGVCAFFLALRNIRLLPDSVGINLLANGEHQFMVSKGVAVMFPLAITAGCLLLVLICRKTLYPWLISVLSLALPLLIWLTNVFPA